MPGNPRLYSFDSTADLLSSFRTYILQSQNVALKRHDAFRIAVSGGSLGDILAQAFTDPSYHQSGDDPETSLRFSHWDIFFADERIVPLDDKESNYNLIKTSFVDKIPESFGKPTLHPIQISEQDLSSADPQDIADLYQEDLMRSFAAKDSVKTPVFDLILLGCGPDGHTCSLFPDHELLKEKDAWVAGLDDSPKPPPKRITLTLPVVTHGMRVAFVAMGEGKQSILKKILDENDEELPCTMVNKLAGERVSWFTDAKATATVAYPRRRGSL